MNYNMYSNDSNSNNIVQGIKAEYKNETGNKIRWDHGKGSEMLEIYIPKSNVPNKFPNENENENENEDTNQVPSSIVVNISKTESTEHRVYNNKSSIIATFVMDEEFIIGKKVKYNPIDGPNKTIGAIYIPIKYFDTSDYPERLKINIDFSKKYLVIE